jgi:homoserine kinase
MTPASHPDSGASASAAMRVSVRVPASTANLGPGYDSFGLALAVYNDFDAAPAADWDVEVQGEGAAHLRHDSHNLVARSARRAIAELGAGGRVRGAHVVCRNGIPTGRGLGSSSAAIVGGVLLGWVLAGADPVADRDEVFALSALIEGHPDNVGAVVYGGFTVCATDAKGRAYCASLPTANGLAAVVVARDEPLRTAEARALLPDTVSHADAAFNVGHAALTVAGLTLGRPELLRVGFADRLHEPYRAAAIPDLGSLREILTDAGADAAALSGAGPTVVGIVTAGDDEAALVRARQVADAAAGPVGRLAGRRAPFAVPIDRAGAVVL